MSLPPPARGPRGPARVKSQDPLREKMFDLFTRSFQRAEKQQRGLGFKVYQWASNMVHRLCGEPWAQVTIFPSEVALARRFVTESRLQVTNIPAFMQHALMANSWSSTWTEQFLTLEKDQFRLYVKALGMEHLRAAINERRGVILAHAHTVFSQIAWRLFEHEGLPEGMTLWQWTWNRPRDQLDDPKVRALEGAREIHAATGVLRDGGLVHALADGGRGGDKVAVAFHNRRRIFQPTFAELAVAGNASVFPVDVVMSIDGQVLLEIGRPFENDAGGGDRAERVERLVRRYADHLARRWNNHANNLPWRQMKRHLDSPRPEAE